MLSGDGQNFILMVGAASIDKQSHPNNAAGTIRDAIEMDRAVGEARKFAAARETKDTLVVVTADHDQSMSIIGVNNSWVSGRGAFYVELMANAGLIGLHAVSSTRHVAPPGGAKATFGTNPIACGFPTAGEAFVIDMGTSAFMSTDLLFRQRRGELLPEGVAIDAEGRPTRDAAAAMKGLPGTGAGWPGAPSR